MLEAAKSSWFEGLFSVYNRNLLRRRFGSFRVRGLEELKAARDGVPLVVAATHTSWWDGLAAFHISRAARLDAYVMMEKKQLERLWLFTRLGAFSVVREDARSAYRSVAYAADLLRRDPSRTLWIFPQGEIVHPEASPTSYYGGVSKIVELLETAICVSAAFRYEFGGDYKPGIFVRIGERKAVAISSSDERRAVRKELKNDLESLASSLRNDCISSDFADYRELI